MTAQGTGREVEEFMKLYDKPQPAFATYVSGGPTTAQLAMELCEELLKKGLVKRTEDGEYEPI